MAETTQTTAAAPAAKVKTPKVGDKVHAVVHSYAKGDRFGKIHVEAEVKKVHKNAAVIDLVIPHDSGDDARATTITGSPRDDSGTAADSWHMPEE